MIHCIPSARSDFSSSRCLPFPPFLLLLVGFTTAAVVVRTGAAAESTAQATSLVMESGVRGGLIVHVGCGDGTRTAALRVSDRFIVHGLDANPDNVIAARERIQQAGIYGHVSIAPWNNLKRLPYAENLINLLVVDDAGQLSDGEMLRVLVPRGTACVKEANGRWRSISKPWPPEMDSWSHAYHGADGNPVSADSLVGPPRRTQWIDGPSWSKKHWGPRLSAMVTAGGRLFSVQDETPTSLFNIDARWVLVARDAFNGTVLWRKELPDWTGKGWGRVVRRGGDEAGLILGVWGELSGGSGARDARGVMVAGDESSLCPLVASGAVVRTRRGDR